LNGLEAAHVAWPEEVDAAAEPARHPLVDDDVAVLVDADEVRPRKGPERRCDNDGDEGDPEGRQNDPAAPARARVRAAWQLLLVFRRAPDLRFLAGLALEHRSRGRRLERRAL